MRAEGGDQGGGGLQGGRGLVISGTSPDGKLVEMVELKDHPWFVACQFHPEFKSTPLKAHPLFSGFIRAALGYRGEDNGL